MVSYTLAPFQEPRGVMRILQFIFAICSFATTVNFTNTLTMTNCDNGTTTRSWPLEYPFRFGAEVCKKSNGEPLFISANVTSDAQFYVATGVLSLLYCVFIIAVYAMIDELYKSKTEIPLADFMLTTVLAVFWLSGSAAWANGATALKGVTDPTELKRSCGNLPGCTVTVDSFSRLNISLIFGFLNFFLWASDLWFLYKETIWFQSRQPASSPGV
ncbi:synaptophysin-like [Phlebotomus argentipes]|uniref:synaptophysin-like n=1 Tax=Phlebotomus argentipes TaxID=94469 RepID=UPI00289358B1|nr:synaptophysin-like [Phlebotomus argentipes]XP_059617524.1 synaptophysin-like [Phlebotomus argentipes]XP_059617526.1 synaptophysin-like [Phlebotomus argentipes]XP_059617527.1 synaptophysin-like [Phlebotomus argentipes]XP_059617528.1 synaptophysin-like [Phlebotomus argentipes]XP_059617529.1 synaptophysin-like [Phlebotomus argentipes]XP_059617530.1 synaptophysin-like [Phlebotomus argentipes]XP_059617531.1 synaptophysin-like [Phlebotomus argentipes]